MGNSASALANIESLVQRGLLEQAELSCRELLKRAPKETKAWDWLGSIALRQGRHADAENAFREATIRDRYNAAYWSNLGTSLMGQQKSKDAEQCFRRAVKIDNSLVPCWENLAACLMQQGSWAESLEAARQALARNPQSPIAWSNVGDAEHKLGRLGEAQQAFERSLAIAPDKLNVIAKYAQLLTDRGRQQEATQLLRDVLARDQRHVSAWIGLGNSLRMLGHLDHAVFACERAVELAPTDRDALLALAFTKYLKWSLFEAEFVLNRLVASDPQCAHAWSMLGTVLSKQARSDEAIPAFRRSVEIAPDAMLHSTLLANLSYVDESTPDSLLAEHQAWDAKYARPLLPAAPIVVPKRDFNSPLRIGFVSADFGVHPVGFLALPALEHLDKARCSIVCYSDRVKVDEFTARFQAAAHVWRNTVGQTNDELVEQIRSDQIDVLIDLMGHTGQRLLVFAHKPAPVQITWLGYVGTTGMTAMDYLLADRFHVAPGEESVFAETVLRMPNGYACYGPLSDAPMVGPLPALSNGYVTFGCFNNPAKFTPRMFDAWSQILLKVPSAKLLLKYGGLEPAPSLDIVRGELSGRGVDSERIILAGWSPAHEFLSAYSRIDLALDTQPYSGGVTTCEALWMGVPVITFPGRIFASRHSTSHLINAGYEQFVAKDVDSYVELAVDWAGRIAELAAIRSEMRQKVSQSALCDAPRFAQDFLALLTQAYSARASCTSAISTL